MHHVLCVAAQERQAEELSVALAQLAEVLVVGLCDPHQAAAMARVVGAELIVTLAGTPLPQDVTTLNIPTLFVPQGASPAEVVQDYLQNLSEAQAAPPEEVAPRPGSWPQLPARLQMRIGFYGLRGGVGVTTATTWAPPPWRRGDRRRRRCSISASTCPWCCATTRHRPHRR